MQQVTKRKKFEHTSFAYNSSEFLSGFCVAFLGNNIKIWIIFYLISYIAWQSYVFFSWWLLLSPLMVKIMFNTYVVWCTNVKNVKKRTKVKRKMCFTLHGACHWEHKVEESVFEFFKGESHFRDRSMEKTVIKLESKDIWT